MHKTLIMAENNDNIGGEANNNAHESFDDYMDRLRNAEDPDRVIREELERQDEARRNSNEDARGEPTEQMKKDLMKQYVTMIEGEPTFTVAVDKAGLRPATASTAIEQ